MIIWNNVTLRQRTLKLFDGHSVQGKFVITTWFFLFIPVYRKEELLTSQ